MEVVIKIKDYDIVVLPLEGRVLGQLQKNGTRKEIFTGKTNTGYHTYSQKHLPERLRSRLVWFAINGPIPDGMQINHINHDVSDDRITNLEIVTCQQNNWYRRKPINSTSGFKGVHYCRKTKNYRSRIVAGGKKKSLGRYHTAEEAARAYDEAARKYFGKFAVLNFPDVDTHSEIGVP